MPSDLPTIDDLIEPLATTLGGAPDPAVRAFAAITLGQSAHPGAVMPLIGALADPEKPVRAMASKALARLGTGSVEPLIASLGSESWVVRYRAAEALGEIRDPRVPGALASRLSDQKDHVRYMAARGLARQPDPCTADALFSLLGDENPYVRRSAADALRALLERVDGVVRERIVAALTGLNGS
ncbi:MAG TPA: HEAT repeat domain-containing protein [Methanoregulaceae archaeon]|nr:HEAT repeat domain-containing protein [Methanoregulaceae archaeon]HQJ88190.1 HEAT repeat domain-containing protein [Methanoregulaceae archaeon]